MDVALDRTELWLSLLRELTASYPGWAVWKNVDSAFAGTGDVDSFAPPADWPAIGRTFERWVRDHELGPLIICRHIPQGPHFMTLQEDSPYLVQLDVKIRGTYRGSTLIDATDLQRLSELDVLGFRRVRPGVEGIIKLLLNGTRKGGRPNPEGLRTKRVADLLADDPAGVALGVELAGVAAPALQRGVDAFLAGTWDLAAMRRVEARFALRSFAEPGVALSRLWFLKYRAPRCPVVSLIRDHERRVPDDRDRWLADVSRSHEVRSVG